MQWPISFLLFFILSIFFCTFNFFYVYIYLFIHSLHYYFFLLIYFMFTCLLLLILLLLLYFFKLQVWPMNIFKSGACFNSWKMLPLRLVWWNACPPATWLTARTVHRPSSCSYSRAPATQFIKSSNVLNCLRNWRTALFDFFLN